MVTYLLVTDAMSKQCGRCLLISDTPSEHFSKDKLKPDGLAVYCKLCDWERRRAIAPPSEPRQPWVGALKFTRGMQAKTRDPLSKPPLSANHWSLTGLKICSKCTIEKPATLEYFHADSRKGIASACKVCETLRAAKKNIRKTPIRFEDALFKECTRCSTVKSKEDFYSNDKLVGGYGIYCKECQRALNRLSYSKYKSVTNRKRAEKISACPKSTMNYRILGLVRKAIARKDIPVRPMSVTKGFWSTVGYDKLGLCAHLEAQFLPGMGWHNMREWHIDHIKPVRLFDFKSFDCPEFAECWGLPNLRPLWARDNLVKGGRYTPTEDA